MEALAGLDLEVPEGAFFGLLGPNGAGKTTLIRSIVGLTRPSGGTISVFGDARVRGDAAGAARTAIGYAPQDVALDRFVPVRELLTLHGRYFGMSRARRRPAGRRDARWPSTSRPRPTSYANLLSGGMRRRLLLARALLHRPRLVILDEPTAGVDLELRHDLWELHPGRSTPTAPRSSSRRTTSRRPRRSASGSPSSAPGGSWPRARRPTCASSSAPPRLEDVYLQLVGPLTTADIRRARRRGTRRPGRARGAARAAPLEPDDRCRRWCRRSCSSWSSASRSAARSALIDGVPYEQFIVPGLVLMGVATSAFGNNGDLDLPGPQRRLHRGPGEQPDERRRSCCSATCRAAWSAQPADRRAHPGRRAGLRRLPASSTRPCWRPR